MTTLLKSIKIYPSNNLSNPITLTDDIDVSVKISQGSKGSYTEIKLKNAFGEHINNSEFKFGESDIVKLYVKWIDEPTDTLSSTDLLMTSEIAEVKATGNSKESSWLLKCMDRTYLIMNRLWAYNYKKEDNWTAPTIIQNILNIATTNGRGTFSTILNARLAEGQWVGGTFNQSGGYIQNVRPDNSNFPTISFTNRFKPVYEWIDALSQIEYTNSTNELDNVGGETIKCKRPYFFYIDENNNFHWEYPDFSSQTEITFGNENLYNFELTRSVFDIINMVIFNPGKDFYGSGILDYYYDRSTKSPKLKMVSKTWDNITNDLIGKDILAENPTKYAEDNTTPGTLTWQGKRYTASYNFTPHWTSTAITDDGELNDSLRNAAITAGKAKSQAITQGYANARWKGKMVLKGHKYILGELINFNSTQHGILNALIRITDIQHSINKDSWTTTISVEEDPAEVSN